jgi:hypothetical protein
VKLRIVAIATVGLTLACSGAAQASSGPKRLQLLAAAQTELLFAHLKAPQVASPATCNEGQGPHGFFGEFLLPTLSFGTGDATFTCQVDAHAVVLDLGGAIASEDARGDTWTTAGGQALTFTRANLERICDDVLRYFPAPAPATLDGKPIGGALVSTPAFDVFIPRSAPDDFWTDSVAVGHAGRLAAASCGWKTELRLAPGHHTIAVDLSDAAGAPTHFTYDITVGRGRGRGGGHGHGHGQPPAHNHPPHHGHGHG